VKGLALLATVMVVAGLAVSAGPAHGDADPPSDVLYLQDAYYPYHPKVSTAQQNRLDDLLKRTRRAGFPMKVAIIATATDLGAIPQLFGKPQPYAHFLEQELSVHRNLPLLTVMPAGYGTAALGPRAGAIIATLPHAANPDAMASGAVTAVEHLAAANGHPVSAANLGAGGPKHPPSSSPALLLAPILGLAVIALTAGAMARVKRRRR
jgi:hypothetical protein